MPKRRRTYKRRPVRRRVRRRRRRIYRRRKKQTFTKWLFNQLCPPCTYLKELSYSRDIAAGKYYWCCPPDFALMNTADLEAGLGDLGEGSRPLGGATADVTMMSKYVISQPSIQIECRNLTLHPQYVKVYWVKCRQDIWDDNSATLVEDIFMKMVEEGLKERMLDADETSIALTRSAGCISSASKLLNPWMATSFWGRHFKIMPDKGGMLAPGDTVTFSYNSKRRYKYTKRDIVDNYNKRGLRNTTVFPLLRFFSCLGNDTVNRTEIIPLDGNLDMVVTKRHTYRWFNNNVPLIAINNTKNSTFTTGGEGPVVHNMANDE